MDSEESKLAAVRSIAWLDRWCSLYAMITLPATKKNICRGAVHQHGQRKTDEESGDVQRSAFIKWMRGSADVVERN